MSAATFCLVVLAAWIGASIARRLSAEKAVGILLSALAGCVALVGIAAWSLAGRRRRERKAELAAEELERENLEIDKDALDDLLDRLGPTPNRIAGTDDLRGDA